MLDSVKNREAFNKKNQQEIKNIEEIEKENNQKDKVKENELYQKLCNYFEVNNIEAIKKEISLLSEEAIYRHQIDKLVKQFFLSALSKGDIFTANYFKELPFYSSEGIDNDKLKWAIKYCARFIIERGLKSKEVSLLKKLGISETDWKDAAILALPQIMSKGDFEFIDKIIKKYNLSSQEVANEAKVAILNMIYDNSDFLEKESDNDNKETKEIYAFDIGLAYDLADKYNSQMKIEIKKTLINNLNNEYFSFLNDLLDIKQIDSFNQFIKDQEIQTAAKKAICQLLENYSFDSEKNINVRESILIIKNNILSSENSNSPDVLDAVIKCVINLFSNHKIDDVLKIQKIFSLKEEIIINILQKSISKLLSKGNENDFNYAIQIKEIFDLSEKLNNNEINQAVSQAIMKTLSKGNIDKALEIKNKFNLPDEFLNSYKVQQAAQEGMINRLSYGDVNKVFKIKNKFNLSEVILPEIAKKSLIIVLSDGDIDKALEIKDEFNLPDEFFNSSEVQQAAQEGMINRLSYGDINKALQIKNNFNLSESLIIQAAQEGMIKMLKALNIHKAFKIKYSFNLPDEFLNSLEVQKLAQELMIDRLSFGDIYNVFKIKDKFNLPDEFLNSYKVQQAAQEGMINRLSYGDIDKAIIIKEEFNLSEEVLIKLAQEVMIDELLIGDISTAIRIKDNFNFSNDFINSYKIKKETKKRIVKKLLDLEDINSIFFIKEEFNLSESLIIQVAKEVILNKLSDGNINKVLKIKESFNLPDEFLNSFEVQQAAKQGMINKLLDGCINSAFEIKDKFNLPDEFLNSLEVQQATQEITIKMLLNGYIDIVIQIKDDFNLSDNFFNSYKVQQAAQEGIIHELLDDNINNAVLIKEEFNLPETTVIEAAKQVMINKLLDGCINSAFEIKNKFNLPDEFLNSSEVQQAVKQGMIKTLVNGDVNNALKIKEKLNLPETILIEAAKQGMIKALMKGNINSVFKIKESFNLPDEFLNSSELQRAIKQGMIRLLSNGDINNALAIKKEFNLPDEFINSLEVQRVAINFLDANLLELDIDSILLIINSFKLPKHYINTIISNNTLEFIEANKYEVIIEIRKKLKLSPDKALNTSLDIFGNFITPEIYQDIKILLEAKDIEDIPKNLKSLGIKKVGDAGISKLKEIISDFKNKLKNPNYHGDNLENPIFESFLKEYVRYKVSQWGDHDDINFKNVIATHRDFYLNGKIKELDERYQPSKILNIAKKKMDNNEGKQFEYSEQFKIRYDILRKSIIEAYKLFEASKKFKLEAEQKGPLNSLFAEFNEIKAKLIVESEEKLIKMKHNPNIKLEAIDNLSKKIDFLKETNFRSIKNFEDNFTKLSEYKEFDELLRKLVFYLAFHSHQIRIDEELLSNAKLNKEPSINELSRTLEFINHITNQETRDKYFNNNSAKKAFIKLTNARALEEEYTRFEDFFQEISGKVEMQFIPTRGLLMEFSGHIADACWASKESCLARNHPNKLALIMVQNPNSIKEKLVGSCILIETKSNKGEPLLIIRGLNPIENVINELSVKDFYQKITDYLKEIANSLGRKLAIVVDDHQGGSGSNRLAVYNFLSENCKKNKVILASFKDTDFNGYNIVNNCYLVE